MADFKIVTLADHQEYIDVCAAWNLGYWSILNTKRNPSFAHSLEAIGTDLKAHGIPMTLIVMDETKSRPVAMGSIWTKDSDYWTTETPWIASVFVHELYRERGLSRMLLEALENEASTLGQKALYLTAIEKVAPLYKKLGYEQIEKRDTPEKHGAVEYLFKKNLVA